MFMGMHSHAPMALNTLTSISSASYAFQYTFGVTALKICALTSKPEGFGETD